MSNSKQRLNIIWAEFIIWDLSLSKTTELEILNGLTKLGHKVELFALRSKQASVIGAAFDSTLIPLRNIRLIVPIMFTIVQALFLPLRVAFSKVDIIVSEPGVNVLGLFPAIILGKLRKTKFVLDIRSPPVEASSNLLWQLENLSFIISLFIAKRFFDGVTIITPQMRSEICHNYGINGDHVGTWPSGVSASIFDSGKYSSEKEVLKSRLGLAGRFVVFYHGFLAEDRGLKQTVEAMTLIKENYPSVVLFFLGSGPYEQKLRELITELCLDDSVKVHGPVDYSEVPKFIAMSDIGIVPLPDLPKWRTQCPLKLLEFLAMSKSVIATDINAHRKILKNCKCGIYTTGDSRDLANAIRFAYENRNNLANWGVQGRKIVLSEYSWESVTNGFDNYLRQLIKK